LADLRRAFNHSDTGITHRRHLFLRGSLPSADDGAGMPHATSRRRGLPGDEPDHGLRDALLDIARRFFFRSAADLADHDDRTRVGVRIEHLDGIPEGSADNGIAANPYACRLADAQRAELTYRFVSQGAAARDYADATRLVNVGRHDSDLAF